MGGHFLCQSVWAGSLKWTGWDQANILRHSRLRRTTLRQRAYNQPNRLSKSFSSSCMPSLKSVGEIDSKSVWPLSRSTGGDRSRILLFLPWATRRLFEDEPLSGTKTGFSVWNFHLKLVHHHSLRSKFRGSERSRVEELEHGMCVSKKIGLEERCPVLQFRDWGFENQASIEKNTNTYGVSTATSWCTVDIISTP